MNWKYFLPGVGLIYHIKHERKERKDKKPMYNIRNPKDLKALGNYALQTGYLIFALFKTVSTGYLVYQGVSKGEWNPVNYFKNPIGKIKTDSLEINQEIKMENKLEKTIRYEEILK